MKPQTILQQLGECPFLTATHHMKTTAASLGALGALVICSLFWSAYKLHKSICGLSVWLEDYRASNRRHVLQFVICIFFSSIENREDILRLTFVSTHIIFFNDICWKLGLAAHMPWHFSLNFSGVENSPASNPGLSGILITCPIYKETQELERWMQKSAPCQQEQNEVAKEACAEQKTDFPQWMSVASPWATGLFIQWKIISSPSNLIAVRSKTSLSVLCKPACWFLYFCIRVYLKVLGLHKWKTGLP